MDGISPKMVGYLLDFCDETLSQMNVSFDNKKSISTAKITEVVNFAQRDLGRISEDQSDRITRQKYAAYYAFWFSKIDPLSNVYRSEKPNLEIVDINERIAVHFAIDLLINAVGIPKKPNEDIKKLSTEDALKIGSEDSPVPMVWSKCEKQCSGYCFETGIKKYLKYHEHQNFEYIVHSLRHRGVGPYFIVGFLEAVIINSCLSDEQFP